MLHSDFSTGEKLNNIHSDIVGIVVRSIHHVHNGGRILKILLDIARK